MQGLGIPYTQTNNYFLTTQWQNYITISLVHIEAISWLISKAYVTVTELLNPSGWGYGNQNFKQ
jgi:hypothetical protein